MSSIHSSSSSHYGGLDTTSPPPSKTSALGSGNNDDEEEWLHVPGSTTRRSSSSSSLNKKMKKKNFHSLEMGHDDHENNSIINSDSDSDDNDSDSQDDDDEEYELTDQYTPTITDHITGRTTLLRCCSNDNYHWRPKERVRCIVLLVLLTICLVLSVVYVKYPDNIPGLLRSGHGPPPGALGVGHASYDTVHSSYLEEYNARLTLYRHRSTGAEYLAFVPDNNKGSGYGGDESSSSSGYDPKPDKVFGIAFRTKPESSTGVPHILEREFIIFVLGIVIISQPLVFHSSSPSIFSFAKYIPSKKTRSYADLGNIPPGIHLHIYSRDHYKLF